MAWIFGLSLFLSAALLFAIQPMMGKVTLPKFGGGPAVWNTCMVFYQATLLAGYAYAHFAPQRLGPDRQRKLHLVLLVLPMVLVPLGWLVWPFAAPPLGMAEDWAPPATDFPAPFVLLVLLSLIGLPFFVLSTSAPLLQKWYASTGRPGSSDPYFLYAASNLGSLIALLSYPFVIERELSLTAQGWIWLAAYVAFAGLIATCMFLVARQESPVAEAVSPVADSESPVADAPGSPPGDSAAGEFFSAESVPPPGANAPGSPDAAPTNLQRFFWVARAFVPSSMMLGLTTHFTTEIAPVPLLWVLPLAVYLVSFIIAFSRLPTHRIFTFLLPSAILQLALILLSSKERPSMDALPLHLAVLFVVATALHGAIAQDRPSVRHLTEFFLWIAVGGVLGGGFNAWVAPLAFPGVAEYPLALVLAALVMPTLFRDPPLEWRAAADIPLLTVLGVMGVMLLARLGGGAGSIGNWIEARGVGLGAAATLYVLIGIAPVVFVQEERGRVAVDWLLPLALFFWTLALHVVYDTKLPLIALVAMLVVLAVHAGLDVWQRRWVRLIYLIWPFFWAARLIQTFWLQPALVQPTEPDQVYLYGVPLVMAGAALDRPLRFGLGLGAVFLVGALAHEVGTQGNVLYRERSFFGICKVTLGKEDDQPVHYLVHGSIMHGLQPIDPELRQIPSSYYHSAGPIGDLFLELKRRLQEPPVAVIGLGTGSLSSWAQPGQELVFFDIDPTVVRIAWDPKLFSYLTDARNRGVNLRVVLGDGRVMLGREPDGRFGVIVIDAFSSDSIPTHLLTRQAVQAYLRKLAPRGVIAVHISNRYLDLEPVLGNLAADAGLVVYHRIDSTPGLLKSPSDWVLLARHEDDLAGIIDQAGWQAIPPDPTRRLWTDDFSNLLDVYRRKKP